MMKKLYLLLMMCVLFNVKNSTAQTNLLTESFNTTPFPATGWTRAHVSGGATGDTWKRATSGSAVETYFSFFTSTNPGPHTGTGMAWFNTYNYDALSTANLVTPALDFTSASTGVYRVSFWAYRGGDGDAAYALNDRVKVYVNTSVSATGATLLGSVYEDYTKTPVETARGWRQYTFDVPSTFSTASNYIIFQGVSDYGYDIIIDDVSVDLYANCTGAPATPIVTGPPAACPSTVFALSSVTNLLPGITHQWQTSAAATGPWTNVGTASTYSSPAITATTYFRLIDKCTGSGLSDTSAVFTVNVATGSVCSACTPSTTYGCSDDNITHVAFSTINNYTGCSGLTTGSSVFPAPCPNLTAGSVYSLTVSTHEAYGDGDDAQAWIDFDQNGTFATTENVLTGYASTAGLTDNTYTVSVTIPSGATPGLTLLRVRCNWTGSSYTPSPCNNYAYGQTHDYYINIVAPCTGAPTAVTATPSATTVCIGGTLTLTGAATGATTYAWTGPNSFTSTSLSPAGIAVSAASAGIYTLVATNACGSTTVTTSSISTSTAPTGVTATASGTTLCTGNTLTLTGAATGATSYAWSGPGGYTSTSLNPAAFSVVTLSGGIYTLTATNSCGNLMGYTASVVVDTLPTSVTATASSTALCSGASLSLTGTATGATGYSWSGPGGYSAAVLNPSAITTTPTSGGVYSLTATNACGNSLAYTASVTINIIPTSVTASASPTTLCTGGTLTLTGAATGATSYSWAGPGAYSSTSLNPAGFITTTASAGIYTLTATSVCGSTTANTASVTVNTAPTVVTATATPATLCSGSTLTLTGSVTSPITTTYSWSGPGSYTSTSLNPSGITTSTASAGVYVLTATNTCGNTTASTASVTINTVPTSVTANPSATTLCSGDALTLIGTSASPITTTYSWAGPGGYSSTDLNPAVITTSTTSAGYYILTATNICGGTADTTALITINTVPTAVTATAAPTTLCTGATLTLTGTATSTTGVTYAWSGPAGYASTSLNPSAITTSTASAGIYTLTAANGCGNTVATTASVTVNTVPTAVTATPSATSICSGDALTLTATVTSPITTVYSWTGPDGFTSTDLNPAAITTSTASAGVYMLTASNICGSTSASTPSIFIRTVPTGVTATVSTTSVCFGSTFTINGTSTGAASYLWSGPNGYTSTNLHPSAITATLLSGGIYTLTATNICGSTVATTATLSINTVPSSVSAVGSPTLLCSGTTFTLTGNATNAGSYLWNGPGGYTSTMLNPAAITVSPTSAGVYTLTATNVCGNTTATTSSITIIPVPTSVTAISIATSLCEGSTLSLVGTATNGTSFLWNGPGGYTSTMLNPPSFVTTPAVSGVYTLSATNSCLTVTATVLVSIYPYPMMATITGPTSVCAGSTAALSASLPGGVWSSSAAATATVNSAGVVTGISSGSANISYTITNGCATALSSAAVSVIPVPASNPIVGDSIVCLGSPAPFTNASAGGTWASSNGSIANVSSGGIVTGVNIGSAIISYTVSNSCGTSVTDTMEVRVSALPTAGVIAGSIRVCMADTMSLVSTATGGTWYASNGHAMVFNGAMFNGLVVGVSSGVDTIMYVVGNTCGTDTAKYAIYVRTATECVTGINTVQGKNLSCSVYPNPNGGTFTLAGTWAGNEDNATVQVMNTLGQLVYTSNIAIRSGSINEQINLDNSLAAGVYLLHVSGAEAQATIRFTIDR